MKGPAETFRDLKRINPRKDASDSGSATDPGTGISNLGTSSSSSQDYETLGRSDSDNEGSEEVH